MLRKEEIETAVKNGMGFNRKPNYPPEPVLTRITYDLLKRAFECGYKWGSRGANKEDCSEEGFVQLLNDYFGEPLHLFGEADDNRQE